MHLAVAACLALSALPFATTSSPAITAKERTPDDSVMVVAANLREAWDYGDVKSHWDMDKFVNRLLDEFRYRPDILALQEVRKASAEYVARKLSGKSGQPYKVVGSIASDPYSPYGGGRAAAKATAIVINTKTMKVLNNGGYFATVAKPEHEVEPYDPVFHQYFALLQKRGTNMKFATMSVHLLPRSYMASTDLDRYYRTKWSKQMHNKLRSRYGGKSGLRYLIAGDFNQLGCERGIGDDCRVKAPFWKKLTDLGYKDTAKTFGTIDFIWSKGMPGALNSQDSGFRSMSDSKAYSDHAFRWAVLGPDIYPPLAPKPFTSNLEKTSGGKPVVQLHWGKGDDRAGTGIKKITFERKLNTDPWKEIPPWRTYAHYDYDLQWGDIARYRVRAYDNAGNMSPFAKRYVEVKR